MATSFTAAARLVAEREVRSFLRMKGTWIGLGFILVALFAAAILPKVLSDGPDKVAAVGSRAASMLSGKGFDVRSVGTVAAAEKLVRDDEVDAAVVPADSASGVRVVAL